ncbi:MAG: FAD-binding oxidoreductase [Gammaproteobacteria bacterium]|nr:FAD-binding oxidoreductase [Gammaproteobacteria bacterium]
MEQRNNDSMLDLQKILNTTVGVTNVIYANDNTDKITPYLEESRGRKKGVAFAVVFPSTTDEVAKIVAACRHYKVPIVPQGGNTGRCFGAQTNNPNAVIINLKNMNRIRDIDADNMTMTVEAGCILQDLQDCASKAGLFFPLCLGAKGSCHIGGNLATNAGGINVLRYGNARELTLGIEAVTANGTVLNELYGLRKNNTGYDLKNLLIGSEGTLGIITAVTLKLFPPEVNDEHGFIAVTNVSDAVTCLRRAQARFAGKISTFELIPNAAIQLIAKHSDVRCPIGEHHPWYIWYKIADTHADTNLFDDNLSFLESLTEEGLVIDATVSQNQAMKNLFAHIRETLVEVQKHEGAALKFDVSVPISATPTLIEKGNKAIEEACPGVRPYPFGHVGDGNLHYNLMRPEHLSDKEFIHTYKDILRPIIHDIVDGLDGSFSAEHGIGSQKVKEMKTYKDPVALDMMRRIKHAFDPFGIMNPDKVIPPLEKKQKRPNNSD